MDIWMDYFRVNYVSMQLAVFPGVINLNDCVRFQSIQRLYYYRENVIKIECVLILYFTGESTWWFTKTMYIICETVNVLYNSNTKN